MEHKCAVVGVSADEAVRLGAQALCEQQHRGRASTGLGGITTDGALDVWHSSHQASEAYTEEVVTQLESLRYIAITGQDRYPTSGLPTKHFQPIRQPHLLYSHNGNLSDLAPLQQLLDAHSVDYSDMNDSEQMAAALDAVIRPGVGLPEAVAEVYPSLRGAFTCTTVGADRHGRPVLVGFRDHFGIRPATLARVPGGHIIVSETVGLPASATDIRDIEPGEMVVIYQGREPQIHKLAKADLKLDIFEFIYFARPDSILLRQRVGAVRERFGRELARQYGNVVPGSVVMGVPSSATPYAAGFANELGLCHEEKAIIKRPSAGRSFMEPTQKLREQLRDYKYIFNEALIRGRNINLIDDSIVRMTTARYLVEKLMQLGARSVSLFIGSPPISHPNFYGIDTPSQEMLAAATMDVETMRREIGCARLGFLSLERLLAAVSQMTQQPPTAFEVSCFTGIYPISIGDRRVPRIHHAALHSHGRIAGPV